MKDESLNNPAPNTKETPQQQPTGKASNTNDQMLIDSQHAASLLGISKRTLWTLSNCNAIPSVRIGKLRRYVPGQLHEWVNRGCPTEPQAGNNAWIGSKGKGA